VLYQRSANGHVFDITEHHTPGTTATTTAEAEPETTATEAPEAAPAEPSVRRPLFPRPLVYVPPEPVEPKASPTTEPQLSNPQLLPPDWWKPQPQATVPNRGPRRVRTVTAPAKVRSLAFSPDGRHLAVGGEGGVLVADLADFRGDQHFDLPGTADSVVFDPAGTALHVMYQSMGQPVRRVFTPGQGSHADDRGSHLVAFSAGPVPVTLNIRVVDGESRIERTGVLYTAPEAGPASLSRFAAHNDSLIAIATGQGEIMLWQTTGKYLGALSTFSAGPVAFLSHGNRLVHGDRAGAMVVVHDLGSGAIELSRELESWNSWAVSGDLLLHRPKGTGVAHLGYVDASGPVPLMAVAELPWNATPDYRLPPPAVAPVGLRAALPLSDDTVEVWDGLGRRPVTVN
jgi:WD40 repeat protein